MIRFFKWGIFFFLSLAAVIVAGYFVCPHINIIPKGKDKVVEKLDLTQIRLKGDQKIIIGEATGLATGEYFIDHMIGTFLGDFDLGTYGNRRRSFDGQMVTIAYGYTADHDFLSHDAYGTIEYDQENVFVTVFSQYIPPQIIYQIPSGFAVDDPSFFKGSVKSSDFEAFIKRRINTAGYQIMSQNAEEFGQYLIQYVLWDYETHLRPFYRGKNFSIKFILDGNTFTPSDRFTGDKYDFGSYRLPLDTIVVEN